MVLQRIRNLHWLYGRKLNLPSRRTLRATVRLIAAVASLWCLGLLSNATSRSQCVGLTESEVTQAVLDIQSGTPNPREDQTPKRVIHWITADSLRELKMGRNLFPVYVPSNDTDGLPWAYTKSCCRLLPFMVPVYYGYDVTGQTGSLGVHFYLTFFTGVKKVADRKLGTF